MKKLVFILLVVIAVAGCKKGNTPKTEKEVVFELEEAKGSLSVISFIEYGVYPDSASGNIVFRNFGSEKIECCENNLYFSCMKDDSVIIFDSNQKMKYKKIDTLLFIYPDVQDLSGYHISVLKDNDTRFLYSWWYKRK